MSAYRVFFRSEAGICGRLDFAASDDDEAIATANILCDACSDECDSFEVWNGGHCIVHRTRRTPCSVETIRERHQAAIVECEDSIQRSEWAIAKSRTLMKRTAELRASEPAALLKAVRRDGAVDDRF